MKDKLVELLYYEKIIEYVILIALVLALIISCIVIIIKEGNKKNGK